ncbi:cupin domain-containing protein [soil metagenome]
MSSEKVNLAEKLALFDEHWSPKLVGELNGQHVKLVKLLGEFVWPRHDDEDEMFLVLDGRFRMEFRDHEVWIKAGEFIVVPQGIEPASTLNTGNVTDGLTKTKLERI